MTCALECAAVLTTLAGRLNWWWLSTKAELRHLHWGRIQIIVLQYRLGFPLRCCFEIRRLTRRCKGLLILRVSAWMLRHYIWQTMCCRSMTHLPVVASILLEIALVIALVITLMIGVLLIHHIRILATSLPARVICRGWLHWHTFAITETVLTKLCQ